MIRAILRFFTFSMDDRWLLARALDKYDDYLKASAKTHAQAGSIERVHQLADELREVTRLRSYLPDLYDRG